MATSPEEKRAVFHELHRQGCFVIPNPWDVGSAIALQALGFKALASTSSGFAWSRGLPDNKVARDEVLLHLSEIAAAVDIPVNADFEGAFAVDPEGVAVNVGLAAQTGIAGLSVEDSTGDAAAPLFEFDLAVARVAAARSALDGGDVLLTARSEGFITGRPDMAETIRRLVAFSEAWADCLYAPGIHTEDQIAEVVAAVAPKPVNVLSPGLPLATLEKLGARRISVGGALARAAWAGFYAAAREIAERGEFSLLAKGASGRELNALFAARA
jgi:methylisocitrate lyase